ncbi:hypothetical protein D3C72_1716980 [compost metagenome]
MSRSPGKHLARSAETIYRGVLRERLASNPLIRVIDETQVKSLASSGSVTLEHVSGDRSQIAISALLIAQGRVPNRALAESLLEAGISVVSIGDARRGGRIGDAVHQAYEAVVSLCAAGGPTPQLGC